MDKFTSNNRNNQYLQICFLSTYEPINNNNIKLISITKNGRKINLTDEPIINELSYFNFKTQNLNCFVNQITKLNKTQELIMYSFNPSDFNNVYNILFGKSKNENYKHLKKEEVKFNFKLNSDLNLLISIIENENSKNFSLRLSISIKKSKIYNQIDIDNLSIYLKDAVLANDTQQEINLKNNKETLEFYMDINFIEPSDLDFYKDKITSLLIDTFNLDLDLNKNIVPFDYNDKDLQNRSSVTINIFKGLYKLNKRLKLILQ